MIYYVWCIFLIYAFTFPKIASLSLSEEGPCHGNRQLKDTFKITLEKYKKRLLCRLIKSFFFSLMDGWMDGSIDGWMDGWKDRESIER